MTKAEELKVLDKIEALIKSAGEDSYIGPTFAGIVEICRSNIENDFGDHPLEDLEAARKKAVDLAKIAMDITDERDKLKADFDELAGAYREAVGVCRVASLYIHQEKNRLCNIVDDLPVDASDDEISVAVRNHKKAKEAARRCSEVLDKSMRKPFCFAMQEE